MTAHIRDYQPGDISAANYVCMKTGDNGQDGEPFLGDDPDALGRIYTEPYLRFSPELALMLEDEQGVCGYAMAVVDSHEFFDRYEREWRPQLVAKFPAPQGDSAGWTRLQAVYNLYHHPDYYCPEPYDAYPSHLHIDLLPRAQGQGHGRKMMQMLLERLRATGSAGVHLGLSEVNERAYGFYLALGFKKLIHHEEAIYMGMRFS